MHQNTFARYAILAFALVLVSFLVRGLSQLVVSTETATWLSMPIALLAAALVVVLFARSILAVSGLRPLDEGPDE